MTGESCHNPSVPPDPNALPPGLYETAITRSIESALQSVRTELVRTSPLASAEAPNRIALHLARQIEAALRSVGNDDDRLRLGHELVQFVLQQLSAATDADLADAEIGRAHV